MYERAEMSSQCQPTCSAVAISWGSDNATDHSINDAFGVAVSSDFRSTWVEVGISHV